MFFSKRTQTWGFRLPEGDFNKYKQSYQHGDVYRKEQLRDWRLRWWLSTEETKKYPYLEYVQRLLPKWPHLELLSDFMQVGTTPVRWDPKTPGGYPEDMASREIKREERVNRVNVSLLQYNLDGSMLANIDCKDKVKLRETLDGLREDSNVSLRLFVVEDLSREVIDALGTKFDVEPAFFRAHLADYVWYNIRDWWREPPNLDVVSQTQNWCQMRFVRARHFDSDKEFKTAVTQVDSFNVWRRLDNDQNYNYFWDTLTQGEHGDQGVLGVMRSRTTVWVKPRKNSNETMTAIILLDPTVNVGRPIWDGYKDWTEPPSMEHSKTYTNECRHESFADEFKYWATQTVGLVPAQTVGIASSDPLLQALARPMLALLHLTGGEWTTLDDYIKARVNQVDWDIAFPNHFLPKNTQIDSTLKKLHYWRRVLPIYREMLADSLQQVFRDSGSTRAPLSPLAQCLQSDSVRAYKHDYQQAHTHMEEFIQRVDRLTGVVTAVINIEDSRRSYSANKNLARLTWLATLFIPLSFFSALFSMQPDVHDLRSTIALWAVVSIPASIVALLIVFLMQRSEVADSFWQRLLSIFRFDMPKLPWKQKHESSKIAGVGLSPQGSSEQDSDKDHGADNVVQVEERRPNRLTRTV